MAAEVPASATAVKAAPLLALEPRLQRQFQQKVQRARTKRTAKEELTPGVVFVGHLPRGLYEPQLREYFGQFGTVTRLRLSRSKKVRSSCGPCSTVGWRSARSRGPRPGQALCVTSGVPPCPARAVGRRRDRSALRPSGTPRGMRWAVPGRSCLGLRGDGWATALVVLFSVSKFTPVGSAGAHQFKVQLKCHDSVLIYFLFCVR
ncbi:hypothetical protein Nmel_009611 [Mimus melanotis]